ncbi:mandelamide amidase [Micromonospora rhizosphaerae]|uniref:Mandelamide amidase n=1 Tax=Micromonospora rhizosphaerae TaxID=568872 RepID=A0A1C6SDI9_9ACTN|nr:amidase family protein [Micromonospora rhizosphaerae]SCL27387.1 mandelamide amidase [Micromonospora rhizosphaerae]
MSTDKPAIDAAPAADDRELADLGVAAAATAIRQGDISAESYSAALLKRARRYSDLQSFITIDESAVLAAAAEADKARAAGSTAPLLGVPLGVKDSYATRGLRTTLGVKTLETFIPSQDADVVRAIKNAGGIVFGKNNLVEMSYGLTGDNDRYGQVKNPHGREHIPGGSSSGSAASVAARIVPASFGGDTIGSIRVPAALTGVVGFKPTIGRWPGYGVAPVSHTLDTTGLLARNVDDCILIDQIVAADEFASPSKHSGLKDVRFAYAPKQFLGLVDPEIESQFVTALHRLRDAGAEVLEIDLGEDFSKLADRVAWNLFFRETQQAVSEFLRQNDVPVTFDEIYDDLKPQLKEVWNQFVIPSGPGYLTESDLEETLSIDRPELQRRLGNVFGAGGFDALAFPTTAALAPLIEDQWSFTVAGERVDHLFLAKNTIPASGAGLPGISLPIGLARSGLPLGIELDGARGDDRKLLDVARRVENVLELTPA